MGIFRKYITVPDETDHSVENDHELSDRIITPATLITLSRPILAAYAADMLRKGEKGVTIPALLMFASDAEGNVARLMDKMFPDLGIGSSKMGAKLDNYADALAILILSGGVLAGKNVSPLGKAAVGIALGQEGTKLSWALNSDRKYRQLTESNEHLWIPPTLDGKEAMAEKLLAVGLAATTNDIENPVFKHSVGAVALGFATEGAYLGNRALTDYKDKFEDIIGPLLAQAA